MKYLKNSEGSGITRNTVLVLCKGCKGVQPMANIWAKYFETFVTDLEQTLGVDSAGFKTNGVW